MSEPNNDLRALEHPRELLPHERALIEQLLTQPFQGRDEIRSQLATARVTAEGDIDTRSGQFELTPSLRPRAHTATRVPVEAEAIDDDGVPIAVLLHVVDGLATELEIYRVDGQPIRRRDFAAAHTVVVNEGN